jgi:hypothetical protein
VATDEADGLYALPLEDFTAARNALAARLRADGDRDGASTVAALQKPVLAAWVVNRLARDERRATKGLLDAAESIRRGRSGGEERMRDALESLMRAARTLLAASGGSPSDAVLRDVATTLRTGAAEAPEELANGRLTRPLEPSGFAAMAGATFPARRDSRPPRKPGKTADDSRVEKAERAVEAARQEAHRLEAEASEAERAAGRLRADADRAARRLRDAEKRLADARGR